MALAAATAPSPLWYFTRASGVVALLLLTVTVTLGVLSSLRFSRQSWPRFLSAALHRNVSLLAGVFVALHVVTTVLDTYAPIGWPAVVVPFSSAYRRLWTGLGAVAFDLLLALTITSLLRARLRLRVWRIVHWTTYACWPVAVLHGLGTGTDATQPVIATVTWICVAAVITAVAWRLISGWPAHLIARAGGAAAVAVVAIGLVIVFAAGPLQPGWARRAGTPVALIKHVGKAAVLPAVPFTTSLSGTFSRQNAVSGVITDTVNATGGDGVVLRVVITGPPDGNGGVQMTSGQVSLAPAGTATPSTGPVTTLTGEKIGATVTGGARSPVRLDITLNIHGATVDGRLSASPSG